MSFTVHANNIVTYYKDIRTIISGVGKHREYNDLIISYLFRRLKHV